MHLIDLIDELKKELEKIYEKLDYETKKDTRKIPDIKTGWYGFKKSEEDFPYIQISPMEENVSLDENRIKILFVVGVYSKEEDGWKDLALIINKLKMYFEERTIISEKFTVDKSMPLKITYPDSHPYPQWFAFLEVNFNSYKIYNDLDL